MLSIAKMTVYTVQARRLIIVQAQGDNTSKLFWYGFSLGLMVNFEMFY